MPRKTKTKPRPIKQRTQLKPIRSVKKRTISRKSRPPAVSILANYQTGSKKRAPLSHSRKVSVKKTRSKSGGPV